MSEDTAMHNQMDPIMEKVCSLFEQVMTSIIVHSLFTPPHSYLATMCFSKVTAEQNFGEWINAKYPDPQNFEKAGDILYNTAPRS